VLQKKRIAFLYFFFDESEHTSAERCDKHSVGNLDQFYRAAGLSDVLELIPVPATRAEEVAAKAIDCRLAFGKLHSGSASQAFPHDHLLTRKGIVA
jgi:hypothetical protein